MSSANSGDHVKKGEGGGQVGETPSAQKGAAGQASETAEPGKSSRARARGAKLTIEEVEQVSAESIEQLMVGVGAGMHPERAALRAGIDADRYLDWKRLGERGKEPYASLLRRVRRAEATFEGSLLAEAIKGARDLHEVDAQGKRTGKLLRRGDARLFVTILERRFPKLWRPTVEVGIIDKAREKMLDVVERVLLGAGQGELLADVLHELERDGDGTPPALAEPAEDPGAGPH